MLLGKQYRLIEFSDTESLVTAVKDALAEGWTCQGGISASVLHRDNRAPQPWYAQAMIR